MRKKQAVNKKLPDEIISDPKLIKRLKIVLAVIISFFAIMLYANTISHEYTLDDHPAIDRNRETMKGFAGIPTILATDYWYGYGTGELRGPIYRPTSLIVFAIVWQFFPDSPHLYHLVNVLMYAASCLLLFLVLCRLFRNYNLLFPFVCTLLYTAHPIHTEVVNNIKSLDEILCFLFGLMSTRFMLQYISTKSVFTFILGGFCFFLSLISKETGITFLVIIPLVLYFFTDNNNRKIVSIFLLLFVLSGIWLLIRMIIFKDLVQSTGVTDSVLNNSLNAAPDMISRQATVLYILLRYVLLLVFPHPLTSDYNFAQIEIQQPGDPAAMAGIVFFLTLAIYSIIKFKKKSIIVLGILLFLIAVSPVSNFFFLGGSTMAERFMYIPSLGFCLVLTYFILKLTKTEQVKSRFTDLRGFFSMNSGLFAVLCGIVILYSFKTFSRNRDWKNNLTIFSHDVQTSDNSATAHLIYGTSLLSDYYPKEKDVSRKDSILNLGIDEMKRGMEILSSASIKAPVYNFYLATAYMDKNDFQNARINFEIYRDVFIKPEKDVYINLATIYYNLGMYDKSIQTQDSVIKYFPERPAAYYSKGLALAGKLEYEKAITQYQKAIQLKPNNAETYYNRGIAFGSLMKFNEASADYSKAIELSPGYAEAYVNRGNLFNSQKQYDEAIRDFNKAIELKPGLVNSYLNRGVCFINQQKYEAAIEDFNKAIELKPDYIKAYYNRGIALIKTGQREAACADFQKTAASGFQPAMTLLKQYCQ